MKLQSANSINVSALLEAFLLFLNVIQLVLLGFPFFGFFFFFYFLIYFIYLIIFAESLPPFHGLGDNVSKASVKKNRICVQVFYDEPVASLTCEESKIGEPSSNSGLVRFRTNALRNSMNHSHVGFTRP